MKKSTHLKEIAFELGLSINTVSRALRDCDDISEKTKQLIRKKAFEMGYIPNTMSQFIKSQQRLIGIIVDNFTNPYICYQVELIAKESRKHGFNTTIICCPTRRIEKDIFKDCVSQRIDGIIAFTTPSKEFLELAKFSYIPVVFMGELDDLSNYASNVTIDNDMGAMIAANYMINQHSKCKKYVYIGLNFYSDSRIRQEKIKFYIDKNIQNEKYEYKVLEFNMLNSELIAKLLKEGYYNVFCFNDQIAYDVIGLLNETIPNFRKVFTQFHIIGFDALSTKLNSAIDLTSIGFNYNLIITETFRILNKSFENKGFIEHKIVPCKLHQRI